MPEKYCYIHLQNCQPEKCRTNQLTSSSSGASLHCRLSYAKDGPPSVPPMITLLRCSRHRWRRQTLQNIWWKFATAAPCAQSSTSILSVAASLKLWSVPGYSKCLLLMTASSTPGYRCSLCKSFLSTTLITSSCYVPRSGISSASNLSLLVLSSYIS